LPGPAGLPFPRDSRTDALANIWEAIELWLEVEAEEGGVKTVETLELAV
jgi:predicted RNase H-like HicB family nuclease